MKQTWRYCLRKTCPGSDIFDGSCSFLNFSSSKPYELYSMQTRNKNKAFEANTHNIKTHENKCQKISLDRCILKLKITSIWYTTIGWGEVRFKDNFLVLSLKMIDRGPNHGGNDTKHTNKDYWISPYSNICDVWHSDLFLQIWRILITSDFLSTNSCTNQLNTLIEIWIEKPQSECMFLHIHTLDASPILSRSLKLFNIFKLTKETGMIILSRYWDI